MLTFALLVLGLFGLWGGTALTVQGAVRFSERWGWSQGLVGLTVVSIGTDLPEVFVSLSASLQQLRGIDASGVLVGNSIGSSIAQTTLVVGLAGLSGYLAVGPKAARRDGATLFLALILLTLLAVDGVVGRIEAVTLLIAYAIYLVALSQTERGGGASTDPTTGGTPPLVSLGLGLVVVTLSSHVVVTEGIALATAWGVSQTLLGVLVLALGSSLPELAVSVGAARSGHGSLSVGNVIGSSVFDLLVPIGIGALIHPVAVAPDSVTVDMPALAIGCALLLLLLFRRRGIQRREAFGLLVFYAAYAAVRLLVT